MYTLKCAFCHLDFESRQPTAKYCKREHFMDCPVCGVSVKVKEAKRPPRSCSASCNAKLELSKGVPNHVCELCGVEYFSKNPRSRFCSNEHKAKCVACGDSFVIVNNHKPATTCSKKCASSIVDYEEVGAKYRATVRERYGVDNVSQANSVKEKKRETARKRYGVDNVSQVPEVQEKRNKTMNDLYGGYGTSSPVLREKIANTVKEKYGVDNVFQNDSIKSKARETFLKKYGVPHWGLVGKMDTQKVEEWENIKEWLESHKKPPTLLEVSSYFNVNYVSVLWNMERNRVPRELIDTKQSISEQAFVSYLSENHPDLFYICNERDVIPPREVDFFFPDLGIAVELSPSVTYYSNENAFNEFLSRHAKSKTYHADKFIGCLNKNVTLLTYFDWMQWPDFCQSFTLLVNSALGKTYRVYDCEHIDKKTGRDFLNKNHHDKVYYPDKKFVGFYDRNKELVGVCSYEVSNNSATVHRLSFVAEYISQNSIQSIVRYIFDNDNVQKVSFVSSNNVDIFANLYSASGLEQSEVRAPIVRWVHPFKRRKNGNLWSFKQFAVSSYGMNVLKDFPGVNMSQEVEPHNMPLLLNELGFLPVYDCGSTVWSIRK